MQTPAWLAALADLVLPGDCAGCGAVVSPWCRSCAAAIGPQRAVALTGGLLVHTAGRYTGPLRAALLRYKERGRLDLAAPLAAVLSGPLAAAGPAVGAGGLWLVPAPSRPSAARARGGDHVLRLCRALDAAPSGGRVRVASALRLERRARDSVGLDARQRAVNLDGRLLVRARALPPVGARVLLVDDVVTTGATLRACRAALAGAGVHVDRAVVLCDAVRGAGNRS